MNIFPAAASSRSEAITHTITLTEIRNIEVAVLNAVANGQLTTTISSVTTMTDSVTGVPYWTLWNANSTDLSNVLNVQMNTVVEYFTNLGYNITRILNTTTNDTFSWVLSW